VEEHVNSTTYFICNTSEHLNVAILSSFHSNNRSNLEELSWCDASLYKHDDIICRSLHSIVSQSNTLLKLDLNAFHFDEELMELLYQAMTSPKRNSKLRMLSIMNCDFCDIESVHLFEKLVTTSCISTLRLCGGLDLEFASDEYNDVYDKLTNISSMERQNRNHGLKSGIRDQYATTNNVKSNCLKELDLQNYDVGPPSSKFLGRIVFINRVFLSANYSRYQQYPVPTEIRRFESFGIRIELCTRAVGTLVST
jgi:hypothetical protein